jgi:DNA-binding transcriptional LysR family regulator
MARLDLTALRYFSETALCGSIRQAADRLHVTPSAVSRQIAKLEDRLRTTLVERSPSGVRLTQAGRLLAEEVGVIHRLVDQVQSRIGDLEGLRRGTVVIRCMEGAIDSWLPEAVSEFHARYPEVTYDIAVSSTDATVENLIAGNCDIGVTFKGARRPEIGVVATRATALQAFVAPGHPLGKSHAVRIATLLEHPMVLPGPAFGVRRVIDQLFKQHRAVANELMVVNSVAMIRALVRQGIVATILPTFSAAHDVRNGHLRPINILDANARTDMELCVRKGHVLPAASREFLELLKLRLGRLTN